MHDGILSLVGHTPLIRIPSLSAATGCEVTRRPPAVIIITITIIYLVGGILFGVSGLLLLL